MPADLIRVHEFCYHHSIEVSFIHSLEEYGMVEITSYEGDEFLEPDQLGELEKIIRLHFELNINLEGIDAINGLLKKIDELQKEKELLRSRLRLYEGLDT
jgi:hypothetical protein